MIEEIFMIAASSNHLLTTDEIVELKLQSINSSFDSFVVDGEIDQLNQDVLGRFKSIHTIVDDLVIRMPLLLAVDEAMEFMKKNMRLGYEFEGEPMIRCK